ncbi:hypothetical protein FHU35_12905 [Saccharopolyspora dendranthemae]|uniref:Uncharacterized protein n=1 Tax=Saccharopolyspora dendranthemae TaxID=1181886 RepID=A0A561U983_9PSEU|nr:hypothetical protein FHU35_12905 [Saccharopolyspora dendranthemae]
MFKAEVVHKGVTHKGISSIWNSRVKTACGLRLPEKAYVDCNRFTFGETDCPDCLSAS